VPVGTFVEKDEIPVGTFVEKDEMPVGTFVEKDEGPAGSFVVKDEGPADSFVVKKEAEKPTPPKKPLSGIEMALARLKSGEAPDQPAQSPEEKYKSDLNVPKKPVETLDANLDEFNIDLTSNLDIFKKMAESVQKTHEAGILHLDIKGENFLHNRETGTVNLIDFGVSEYMADNEDKELKGSLPWIAPELIVSSSCGKFSTEQDIYSLGRTYILSMANQIGPLNAQAVTVGPPLDKGKLNGLIRHGFTNIPKLENVQFKNDESNPEITALNQMMSLMNEMTEVNLENRPKLDNIILRITNIEADLKQAKELENQQQQEVALPVPQTVEPAPEPEPTSVSYQDAFKDVNFEGKKMGDRFLAKAAIHDFNRQQVRDWLDSPIENRGPKPTDLEIPNNAELDNIIASCRQQAEVVLESPAAESQLLEPFNLEELDVGEPSEPSSLNRAATMSPMFQLMSKKEASSSFINEGTSASLQSDVDFDGKSAVETPGNEIKVDFDTNSMIKKISENLDSFREKSKQSMSNTEGGVTSLMFKFGDTGVKQAGIKLCEKLSENLNSLLSNDELTNEQKLDKLEATLEQTLAEHNALHKGNISKGENSPLSHICKDNIETISQAKEFEGPKVKSDKSM